MSSKITGLTALTSVQTDDVLPVVDIHDTTQASSGTTKQITVANLTAGLLKATSNLSDVGNAGTARTNLGLGTAATAALTSLLQAANNLSDLANAGTARTNLGLTGAATAALPLSLANGGTGQTTQQAALDAVAGAVTSGLVLRGNGTHVTLAAIQAADVPTLNQNTSGTASNITGTLDQVPAPAAAVSLNSKKITSLANGSAASDAAAFGQLPVLAAADTSAVVAGTATAPTVRTGTLDVVAAQHPAAADWSNNSHKITSLANGSGAQDAAAFGQTPAGGAIVSGQYLCTPSSYAPGAQAAPTISGSTMAAWDATNINTGSFTAPASGKVLVSVTFVYGMSISGDYCGFGLAAHSTVTPILSNIIAIQDGSANARRAYTLHFLVTGLTPANSYSLDLLGAVNAGVGTLYVIGQTSTTPTLSAAAGGPVVMTVQAV